MKMFILKIMLLAGIATLVLYRCQNADKDNVKPLSTLKESKAHIVIAIQPPPPTFRRILNEATLNNIESSSFRGDEQLMTVDKKIVMDCYLTKANGLIYGNSTLYEWASDINEIRFKGFLEVGEDTLNYHFKDAELIIPVKSIVSKDGQIVDQKTYKALKADLNPEIIYSFKQAKLEIGHPDSVTVISKGKLLIAGNTKTVSVVARGKILKNGKLHLQVCEKLKMTDFKIKPPTLLLGTIKADNDLMLDLNLIFSLSK